jgi:protein SCO1/2
VSEPKAVSRFVPLVVAFLAGLLVPSVVVYLARPSASPIGPGGPCHPEDQTGRPVSDQDMKGRPFLVFFGYNHCLDICPTKRDTPAALKDYAS